MKTEPRSTMTTAIPRLLIPTRNRPTALRGILEYLRCFYPGTGLIVADGSSESFKPENRVAVATVQNELEVDYQAYPEDMSLFDRTLAVLEGERDEFFIMGGDDDFPMMEVFEQGVQYLREHPECGTAMGASINLGLPEPGLMRARLAVVRNISGATAAVRTRQYAAWPMPTTQALTRRELLLERYRWADELFLAGFYDYTVGIHDATWGTTKAFAKLGYVRTNNYNHSYLRPVSSKLLFLKHSDLTLRIVERFRNDLLKDGALDEEGAMRHAEMLMQRKIAAYCGGPAFKQQGFTEGEIFLHPAFQNQLGMFDELFTEGSETRARYDARLSFIAACLRRNARSTDNRGEEPFYENLRDQLTPGKASAESKQPPSAPATPGAVPQPKAGSLPPTCLLDPDTLFRL